jgi:hypothetical protein
MDKRYMVVVIQAIASVFAIVAVTWGIRYNWPDYVHVKYGLPLTWGVYTLNTIVGPANDWSINLTNLSIDLAFWLGIVILLRFLMTLRRDSRRAY